MDSKFVVNLGQMEKAVISIIIPIYNVESYVEDCIRSVMQQTFTSPLECLLVDDCGTDGSMAVVEKMLADYDGPIHFKVLHHDHNRGLSAARNTGIQEASGEFLMFIDSDDQVRPDFCQAAYACAERHHADLVMFSHVRIKKDQEEEVGFIQEYRYAADGYQTQHGFMDILLMEEGTAAWNKLYRKDLFDEVTFPEGFLYEDEGTIYQLVMKASCIYYLDTILYEHYWRLGSITTQKGPKVFEDRTRLNLQRYQDLKAWGYHSEALEYQIRAFAYQYMVRKRRDPQNPDDVCYSRLMRDTRWMPPSFTVPQRCYTYLFKYCPWLFEFYFTMRGVKI